MSLSFAQVGGLSNSRVSLEPFDGLGHFENRYFRMVGFAPHQMPQTKGCYCYEKSDFRYAYVKAYYHATEFFKFVDQRLEKLGLRELPKYQKKFILFVRPKYVGLAAGGEANGNHLRFYADQPDFDLSVFVHELAHLVQYHLVGFDLEALFDSPHRNWFQTHLKLGVIEGGANALAALYLGQSHLAKQSWKGFGFDLDQFIHRSQLPTLGDVFRFRVSSPDFITAFPLLALYFHRALEDLHEQLDSPEAYTASACFNQVVWRASSEFGREELIDVQLEALSRLDPFEGYSDWAQALVESAETTEALQSYLQEGFRRRGL